MATLVGDSLLVKHVYKSCVVIIANKETLVDLIVLELLELDVILGMDWLAMYHATIDCHDNTIKFKPMGPHLLWCMVTTIWYLLLLFQY